jgi:hypothetical protein
MDTLANLSARVREQSANKQRTQFCPSVRFPRESERTNGNYNSFAQHNSTQVFEIHECR